MKALPNRLVVDVKARRGGVISQWPVLLHEWSRRDLREPCAWLPVWCRGLVICVLFCVLQAAFFMFVGKAIYLALPYEVTALGFLVLHGAIFISFQWSVYEGKPLGLFWLVSRWERPLKAERRK